MSFLPDLLYSKTFQPPSFYIEIATVISDTYITASTTYILVCLMVHELQMSLQTWSWTTGLLLSFTLYFHFALQWERKVKKPLVTPMYDFVSWLSLKRRQCSILKCSFVDFCETMLRYLHSDLFYFVWMGLFWGHFSTTVITFQTLTSLHRFF
jgi:hypothetical protein